MISKDLYQVLERYIIIYSTTTFPNDADLDKEDHEEGSGQGSYDATMIFSSTTER